MEKNLDAHKSGESRFSKGIQKTLAEGHYRLGLRLKKKKQWEEALTQFLEATNKNPNHFKSFFEQALIYRQKQIHDMAVTCLQQALTIKPKYKDARVLLATLQLEKGNVGSAFEQLKESLGMTLDEKSKDDSGKDSDTILQTIHTFIETSQMVASVVAPVMAPPSPQTAFVADTKTTPAVVPAEKQSLVFAPELHLDAKPESKPESKSDPVIDHKTLPVLLAQQAVLINANSIGKNDKNSVRKSSSSKQAKSIAAKPDEDEWTRKLRFLAKNGTGTLKAGEAFFFTEDTGEAILILADGKRIARTVDTPKDRETVVQMRRPDILVPDDLLYNLSLLGKVVAEKVTSPLDAPGSMGDKTSDSISGYASQATRQASESSIQEKSPPSFKLESGRQDNAGESLEPRRMVHWLKDVFHM
ncbi:MAG: tetratricopeptide repeat protein [Cyanobacteria bacterium TGS_CYA1]|nr:tetratricopeptide repeat protein [Cyanobacteria bacterium TGS_CYA1]